MRGAAVVAPARDVGYLGMAAMKDSRATSLGEIALVTQPVPLDEKSWSHYVPTDEARGSTDVRRLTMQLENAASNESPLHVLLAGHAGCGKSTELHRVRRELGDHYHVQATSAERYSLVAFDYKQLLFMAAESLVDLANELDVDMPQDQLETVIDWFDKSHIEESRKTGWNVEAEAGGKLSFLGVLYARFSARLWTGGETRKTAVKYIEERLDHLLGSMRLVVEAIHRESERRKVLLLIEGLDKIEDAALGRSIFFEHRPQLLAIPCSVIFTFPIRLWYDADGGLHGYSSRYLLPMIPVAAPPPGQGLSEEQRRAKVSRGREAMKQILYRRIDEGADLVSEDALDALISASGGVLRDFLYMLRNAALEAQVADRKRIEAADVRAAATALRHDYANRLAPLSHLDIDLAQVYQVLGAAESWPRRHPRLEPAFTALLQSLCVLEYNGERWYDLHPLLAEHLRRMQAAGAALPAHGAEDDVGSGQ